MSSLWLEDWEAGDFFLLREGMPWEAVDPFLLLVGPPEEAVDPFWLLPGPSWETVDPSRLVLVFVMMIKTGTRFPDSSLPSPLYPTSLTSYRSSGKSGSVLEG